MSRVVQDVRSLRNTILSVLPEMLQKLQVIEDSLHDEKSTATIATQTENVDESQADFVNRMFPVEVKQEEFGLGEAGWLQSSSFDGGLVHPQQSEDCAQTSKEAAVMHGITTQPLLGDTAPDGDYTTQGLLITDLTFEPTTRFTSECELLASPTTLNLNASSASTASSFQSGSAGSSTASVNLTPSVRRRQGRQKPPGRFLPAQTPANPPQPTADDTSTSKGQICPVCSKRIACASTLKQHMRIHSGEKPFTCHCCSRAFNHRSNRDRHERDMHKFNRPLLKLPRQTM